MSLSTILDIVIGLTFIYLILSLLVSEIQEILSSVLQWRAEHLKKAIEVLLSGNDEAFFSAAEKLADDLYEQPLIRGLNQRAKGKIAVALRRVVHWLGQVYRGITRTRNTFGRSHTGPSYIPSDKFRAALLTGLDIERLSRLLSQSRLSQLGERRIMEPVHQILGDLKASLANEFLLDGEIKQLEQGVAQVITDFQSGRISVQATLDRIVAQLDLFVGLAEAGLQENNHLRETFFRRLAYLRQGVDEEKLILAEQLAPTITDVISLLDRKSAVYREVVSHLQTDDPLYAGLVELFDEKLLSSELRDSLLMLAKQAQDKAHTVGEGFDKFQAEIETWFDQAMDRSSGVYRRNARGVSILLGVAIAIVANVDTIYLMDRLSRDAALRNSLLQTSNQFLLENSDDRVDPNSATFQETVEELRTASLPIGWTPSVRSHQAQSTNIFFLPQKYLGWLITGLMTSMGASFWFDTLSRVVRVRSTGGKYK